MAGAAGESGGAQRRGRRRRRRGGEDAGKTKVRAVPWAFLPRDRAMNKNRFVFPATWYPKAVDDRYSCWLVCHYAPMSGRTWGQAMSTARVNWGCCAIHGMRRRAPCRAYTCGLDEMAARTGRELRRLPACRRPRGRPLPLVRSRQSNAATQSLCNQKILRRNHAASPCRLAGGGLPGVKSRA
jgi:hypothetical protein